MKNTLNDKIIMDTLYNLEFQIRQSGLQDDYKELYNEVRSIVGDGDLQ